MDVYDKYASMIKAILMSIYSDMSRVYSDSDAIKHEIYNICIEALKDFGASDPFKDKIEDLILLYDNSDDEEEKKEVKEKLIALNKALKIINEDGEKDD